MPSIRIRHSHLLGIMLLLAALPAAHAQSVLFDFDNAPLHASLPLDVTSGTLSAHLSATGDGTVTLTLLQ